MAQLSLSKIFKEVIIVFVACGLSACHENRLFCLFEDTPEDSLPVKIGEGEVSRARINYYLDSIVSRAQGFHVGVVAVNEHYNNTHHLLWFSTEDGLSGEADSLLKHVEEVKSIGMRPGKFLLDGLNDKLKKLESMQLEGVDTAQMIAEVEYKLSRTYVSLYSTLHFGCVNPYRVFNNLDYDPHDTLQQKLRTLYDVETKLVDKKEVKRILSFVDHDSVTISLNNAEPKTSFYLKLKQMLPTSKGGERKRILVNMERLRWQQNIRPEQVEKYVWVNIPSLKLKAIDGGQVVHEMKIVCGNGKTKTPMLNSNIMRIDLNPKWNIPMSIIKHEVADHAQDTSYFSRNHYIIRDKKTRQRYNPAYVTAAALKSGQLRVIQEGGEGNALGRMIFRFKNSFSIFLHDTSSKGTFSRTDRRASHGCIRVEKPLELADFLLGGKQSKADNDTLVSGVKSHSYDVKPLVPLFITYMTMYLETDGKMQTYGDIYGYDDVLYDELTKYLLK